jgi:hypothetical protein
MPDANDTPPFVMHGARDAITGGLVHIEQQVKSIEQAVADNPGLAFDLAKTLIESVCRTVLGERSVAFAEEDDLPKLFRIVTQHLPFLPAGAGGTNEIRESLKRTLNGLSTAVHGICELRNQCGFASHGAGLPRPAMESVQALLAAEAADTIVGFLHRVHRQDRMPPPSPKALYEVSAAFNDFVDDQHEMIRVFDEEFLPSQVLFELAPEPYRVYLAEFRAYEEAEGNDASGTSAGEVAS